MRDRFLKGYSPLKSFSDLSESDKDYYIQQWNKGIEDFFDTLSVGEVSSLLISKQNYLERKNNRGLWIDNFKNTWVGDVCFIDYGFAYFSETAYQHLGLVIEKTKNKLLVVPMTSSLTEYRNAKERVTARTSLFPYKEMLWGTISPKTTLLLNSATYISPARVINVVGSLNPSCKGFKSIKHKTLRLMNPKRY